MRPFAYERATDAATAVAAADPDTMYLGGGTNLVDLMKLGVHAPARLVDVSRLPEDRIEELPDGGLRIGAAVHVLGPDGARIVPMPGLHCLPGDRPDRDTVLEPGDLITAVELPPLAFARRSTYRKVRDRASFSFAVASIAVAVAVDNGDVRDCRIAFGGLAHVPWRATRAEEALRGARATPESFAAAADAELEQAQPLRDNGFKVPLARNLLVGTLTDLCGGA